jgi:hypothetical protein
VCSSCRIEAERLRFSGCQYGVEVVAEHAGSQGGARFNWQNKKVYSIGKWSGTPRRFSVISGGVETHTSSFELGGAIALLQPPFEPAEETTSVPTSGAWGIAINGCVLLTCGASRCAAVMRFWSASGAGVNCPGEESQNLSKVRQPL